MPEETPQPTQTAEAGAQAPPAAVPASPSTADAEQGRWQAWFDERVKPEMAKRDAEVHTLRTAQGRLEAQLKKAREWSDEDLASFTKTYGTYEGAKVHWAKKGVPEWLLDAFHPSRLDETAEKYLEVHGPTKTAVSPQDAEYQGYLAWKKQKDEPSNGKPNEAKRNDWVDTSRGGRGTPAVEVTADNIDALYLAGKVTGDKYRAFLNTGQLE